MAKLKKAQNGLAVAVKKAAPYYKTAKAKDAQAKAGDAKLKELEAKEQAGMGAVDRLIRKPKIEADSARKTGDSLVVAGLTPRSLKKKKMGGAIKKAQMGISMTNPTSSTMNTVKSSALESLKGGFMQASEERKRRATADSLQKNINDAAATRGLQPNLKANAGMMKKGGMIKRADGSYSKRGLWDNIRANKGSGKKPTAAMLKQEKKIKAQTKKK